MRKMKKLSETDKANLLSVLESTDYISSEESEEVSDSDSDLEAGADCKILKKKRLPWRSDYLNNWFKTLIEKSEKLLKKERKGGANFFNRIAGSESSREQPEEAPEYAVVSFEEPE